MKFRLFRIAATLGVAVALAPSGAAQSPQLPPSQTLPYAVFERYLESLRQEGGIPGLSGAILRNGRLEWTAGFGREDIARAIPASPDTPYPVGGLTEAISGLLVGICIDRHLLDIDEPIRKWAFAFPEPGATVRHVLAHTSEAPPGSRFRYDASLFSSLTPVVDGCGGKPYRQFLGDEIIERFGLARSVPGLDITDASNPARELFDQGRLSRFADILSRLAVPYRVDRTGVATATTHSPRGLDAASGFVSSAFDLSRLDAALDAGVPVSAKTLNDMWSASSFGSGTLPTGLGWFVQTTSNERLVWQFGHLPDAGSAIWLRVPNKRLTLILLANSAGLAAGVNFEQGDVTASPFVRIFLRLFL